jgi:uncharacterized membrane protein
MEVLFMIYKIFGKVFKSNYVIALMLIVTEIGLRICNDSLFRKVMSHNVNFFLALFVRQTICTIMAVIVMVFERFRSNLNFQTKYLSTHVMRGLVYSIAAILWFKGTTFPGIPLYLVYFVGLNVAICNVILSQFLLKERVSGYLNLLFIGSMLPLLGYLIGNEYRYPVLLLLCACLLYSLLDCINTYINSEKATKGNLLVKLIPHAGKESPVINNFYSALVMNVIYGGLLIKFGPTQVFDKFWQIGPVMQDFFLMGLVSTVAFAALLQAFKLTTLSSIQPTKILESIAACSLVDHKSLPIPILSGLLLFFCASILSIKSQLKKSFSKGL